MPIGLTESSITLCVLWHTSHSYSILILKEDAMAICHDQICFSFYLFYENLLHCKRFSCHGSQLRYSAKNKLWLNYFSCLGKLKIIPNFPSIKVCWTGSLGNLSFVTAFCQKKKKKDFRLVASMRLDKQGNNKENRLWMRELGKNMRGTSSASSTTVSTTGKLKLHVF